MAQNGDVISVIVRVALDALMILEGCLMNSPTYLNSYLLLKGMNVLLKGPQLREKYSGTQTESIQQRKRERMNLLPNFSKSNFTK